MELQLCLQQLPTEEIELLILVGAQVVWSGFSEEMRDEECARLEDLGFKPRIAERKPWTP